MCLISHNRYNEQINVFPAIKSSEYSSLPNRKQVFPYMYILLRSVVVSGILLKNMRVES